MPLLLVVLLVAGLAARPQLARGWTYVQDQFANPKEVVPAVHQVSSWAPKHGPGNAIDGATNQCWTPEPPGAGVGEFVEFDFRSPVRLLKVIVYAGCSQDKTVFVKQGRPTVLILETTTARARRSRHVLRLADQPGQQKFTVREGDVTRVRLTIAASTGPPGTRVAIGDLQFYRR
jgi:hypothetical protein